MTLHLFHEEALVIFLEAGDRYGKGHVLANFGLYYIIFGLRQFRLARLGRFTALAQFVSCSISRLIGK
jgi:hypothetical protein